MDKEINHKKKMEGGIQVPYSAGRNLPKVARLSITRNVIVQPSAYGKDNRCLLDALAQMGVEYTRAIAVADSSISDEDLAEMDRQGVRGLRFNVDCGGNDDPEEIQTLAVRIAPLKWCICLEMSADLSIKLGDMLQKLPCAIVFDHRGHLPADMGIHHPAFDLISGMMKNGNGWVKLSGLYMESKAPDYSDTIAVGQAYTEVNPDRVLWGTDWPHPSCYSGLKPLPDDAYMLDALRIQAGTEENFHKILVENPEQLFGF